VIQQTLLLNVSKPRARLTKIMISSSDILNSKILIVDDKQANILLLERILLGAGYTAISSTTEPAKVNELHAKNRYDLILLDLQMPDMDGFQVMEALKEIEPQDMLLELSQRHRFQTDEGLKEIQPGGYLPVIVITALPGHKLRALKAGARDFISKPFEIAVVQARVHNMLEVRLLYKELYNYNDVMEQRVRESTADVKGSYLQTIYTLTRAVEYTDEDRGAHVQRISYYTRDLARMLGLDEAFVDKIFLASPMHDIGNIGIPEQILLKPGNLTPEEREIMQGHTSIGASILGNSKSPYLMMAAMIALNHHECWDGSGYPNGKKGADIPLAARIMHICDVYDALRCKRPHKPAFDHQKAVDIITGGDDRTRPEQFDPAVMAAFRQNNQAFRGIFGTYAP
jgi:putative two-component system response regulator